MPIDYSDKIEYRSYSKMNISPFKTSVLYGDTGKRKTTTAFEMVLQRGLHVCADDSWKILEKDIHSDLRDMIEFVVYESPSQLDYLKFDGFDTVILDPINIMVDVYLDLLYEKADWGGSYREKLVTRDPELKGTSILHSMDYRVTRDRFRPIVERLQSAPIHVIYVAHVNQPVKGLTTDTTLRPVLPNATWQAIARPADIIGYITPGSKGFTIGIDESSMSYAGKSRVQGISGKMSLDDFVQAYRKAVS